MADDRMFGESEEPRRMPGAGRSLTSRGPEAAIDIWREDRFIDESSIDLAQYWRLLLKYRFIIAGSFVVAVILGIAATMLMTPIYTAEATLQIDRESARVVESDDVTPRENFIQGEEFFQTQYGLIRSRSLAQRVAESEGLAADQTFLKATGLTEGEGGEQASLVRRQDRAVDALQANLSVQPVRGSRLVAIRFDSPNPALSARLANAFATNFIQSNLDRKFDASAY
jgi:uncharacterized protein involved in exopolysaccharide biosynthesis